MPGPTSSRVPVALCIDVEPDDQDEIRARPWKGFEAALEWIGPIRESLVACTGTAANFGWFLRVDRQIAETYGSPGWIVETQGAAFARLMSEGDELGIHPHAWRLNAAGEWVIDIDDPAWVRTVGAESFEAFKAALGNPPAAHRFGDGFLSEGLIHQLRELEIKVDLTAEPGMTYAAARRRGPSFAGSVPYSAGAPRLARPVSATGGPVLVPLTAIDPDAVLPVWQRIARRVRYPNQPRHRQMVLSVPWPAATFWDLIRRDVSAGQLNIVAFAVRASSFGDAALADLIASKLLGLADHPLREEIAFVTPSAAAASLAK